MQSIALLEDKNLRTKNLDRIDVLEKVGTLLLLPNKEVATTKQVAEFFEVPLSTIKMAIKEHKKELENDGLFVLKGQELKELKKTINLGKTNRCLSVFSTKAIFKIAFLLRDSEKAKQLKQEIFNTDKDLYFELSSNKSILTKRKEEFCFENLKLNFPKEKIERQKRIKNYLVDFCINDTIYLEIDEQGHTGYDKEKDTIRTKTIEQETGAKLIRFNPDKQQPFELICLIAEVLK